MFLGGQSEMIDAGVTSLLEVVKNVQYGLRTGNHWMIRYDIEDNQSDFAL
jgi:hypothetical protein